MTTIIATAKAILFPRNSGVKNWIDEGNTIPSKIFFKKTESTAKMGVRMLTPRILTTPNSISCRDKGLERESGYVQYLFHVKLEKTAMVNERTLAQTESMGVNLIKKNNKELNKIYKHNDIKDKQY